MAKSVPRMPATAEMPRAEAEFVVAEGEPAEEEPDAPDGLEDFAPDPDVLVG